MPNLMKELRTFLLIPLCGGIGVVVSMILEVMYDRGLLIDSYIGGTVALADLQTVVIVGFVLLGILIGVLLRK